MAVGKFMKLFLVEKKFHKKVFIKSWVDENCGGYSVFTQYYPP